jgi:membrane protein
VATERLRPGVRVGRMYGLTFVTAVLFTIGQQFIGLYLGQSSVASSYGATGSVMSLLLWVYYSCQILLLGAEFTRAYAMRQGTRPAPESFAEKDFGALNQAT